MVSTTVKIAMGIGIGGASLMGGFMAYKSIMNARYTNITNEKGMTPPGTYDLTGRKIYPYVGISVGTAKRDKDMLLSSDVKYPLIYISISRKDGQQTIGTKSRRDIEKMSTMPSIKQHKAQQVQRKKYMLYGGIGLGVLVLTIIVVIVIRRRK